MPSSATSIPASPKASLAPKREVYKCQFCNRTFSRSEHRSRHERSHTKERPFKCLKCRSTFVRRDLLLHHDRTVHAKDGGVPLHSDGKRRGGPETARPVSGPSKSAIAIDTSALEQIEANSVGIFDVETAAMLVADFHQKATAAAQANDSHYDSSSGMAFSQNESSVMEPSVRYSISDLRPPQWDLVRGAPSRSTVPKDSDKVPSEFVQKTSLGDHNSDGGAEINASVERSEQDPVGGSGPDDLRQYDSDAAGPLSPTALSDEKSDCAPITSEPAYSRELSVETGVLSMSDDSEDAALQSPPGLGNELSRVTDVVAYQIVQEFWKIGSSRRTSNSTTRTRTPRIDEGPPQSIDGTFVCPPNPTEQARRTSQKRTYAEKEDDGSDGEGSRRRRSKRPTPRAPDDRRTTKWLACPFWKLDPSEHRACFRLTLDGIARVKQHLSRRHTPDFYCEFCMAVFSDQEDHQRHVQSRSCSYRSCKFTGITHQQHRQLSRRSKPNLSEQERWFAIWDIVFPSHPRPASAYMDSDLSEDLCQFREFAQLRGPAMILAEIQANHRASMSELTEAQASSALELTISRGVFTLFEAWLAEHNNASPTQPIAASTRQESLNEHRDPQGQGNSDSLHSIQLGIPKIPTSFLEKNAILHNTQEASRPPGSHEEDETGPAAPSIYDEQNWEGSDEQSWDMPLFTDNDLLEVDWAMMGGTHQDMSSPGEGSSARL
ncbi:hypothetical protein MFIFM68171_01692 [Madurella fahalii]|uniref:C2H2-type domain-containing protein n=1 Tax=Madurella fahalii TaxID=1157608 RepID=A0ABQ0G147_9PEZI